MDNFIEYVILLKIFNYSSTINEYTRISDYVCMCNNHSEIFNCDCNHVATGDISIIKNQILRKILIKGSDFRELVAFDFD